ncbi:MAG: hypothetical protein [Bacteriophage sp.]|nr:MAG: hypothetical protein [Bacteriophage sp.]
MEKRKIEIPECEDVEWQREMLRQLWDRLNDIDLHGEGDEFFIKAVIEAMEYCDALQEYTGY